MEKVVEFGCILQNNKTLGIFNLDRIKRVETPSNIITNNVRRIDARENAFSKAIRGDYGPAVQKEAHRPSQKYPLNVSLTDIRQPVGTIIPNTVAGKIAPIPTDSYTLTRHIKRLGYFLTADIMSVCNLPEYAVYSHDMQGHSIDIDYPFAIVIVMAKEYETAAASNGFDWINTALSYNLYLRLAVISQTIANYIRRLGYRASAEHTGKAPGGPSVLFAPLLLWSGIGEVSRAGIILNPYLGMNFKAAVVLTDMPLITDKPIDFGLQDFCTNCRICAEYCPGSAISKGEKVMYNGYETWKLDVQCCHTFRILNQKGSYCGRCIKVCPWTKPNTRFHNIIRWSVQRSRLARRIAIKTSKMLKPEKAMKEEKWWFDLEEVDGELIVP